MPKTRLQLSWLQEKFNFPAELEDLEQAQKDAKAILKKDVEKPDTGTRALQALSLSLSLSLSLELNKNVSEFDDVCEQIAEHEA